MKNDRLKLASRFLRCSDIRNEWKGIEECDEPVEGVDVSQWTDLSEDSQKAVEKRQEWCHVTVRWSGS